LSLPDNSSTGKMKKNRRAGVIGRRQHLHPLPGGQAQRKKPRGGGGRNIADHDGGCTIRHLSMGAVDKEKTAAGSDLYDPLEG